MEQPKVQIALIIIITILSFDNEVNAQVKIGDNPATINSSSLLELESADKGILVPRMTKAQKDAISSPATGLLVFQTDSTPGFQCYSGAAWEIMLMDTSKTFTKSRNLGIAGKGVGVTKTTTVTIDNTIGEQFSIDDELFFAVSDPIDYSGGDVLVTVDFISMGAETGKTVRWNMAYKVHQPFTVVSGTTGTLDSGDLALDATQYAEQDVVFTIPEADLVGAEAIHFKVIRVDIGAGSDPSASPAVIHCSVRYNSTR